MPWPKWGIVLKTMQQQDAYTTSLQGSYAGSSDDGAIVRPTRRLVTGGIASAGAATLGACIWLALTAASGMHMVWMAVIIGLMVGYTMRFSGRGNQAVFGVAAGLVAMLGCLLGNLMAATWLFVRLSDSGFVASLSLLELPQLAMVAAASYHNTDVLFYAISFYLAFTTAFGVAPDAERLPKD